jgi:hypothetical protein
VDYKKRKGDWIQTFSGGRFYPLDPRIDDINIVDIAHALSNQCRFSGHCRRFYSVAQHSFNVSFILKDRHPMVQLWGLLHDSAEAYLVDVPSPIKPYFPKYKGMEEKILGLICEKHKLSMNMPKVVRDADLKILMAEARDLMGNPTDWSISIKPAKVKIIPMDSESSEEVFLFTYEKLMVELKNM